MRGRTMNLLIRLKRLFFVVLILICVGLGLPTTVFGGTNVIYSFAGDEDGEYPIRTRRLTKPAICTGRRCWEVISAVAQYFGYLLQVTVGFTLSSIALPAA